VDREANRVVTECLSVWPKDYQPVGIEPSDRLGCECWVGKFEGQYRHECHDVYRRLSTHAFDRCDKVGGTRRLSENDAIVVDPRLGGIAQGPMHLATGDYQALRVL